MVTSVFGFYGAIGCRPDRQDPPSGGHGHPQGCRDGRQLPPPLDPAPPDVTREQQARDEQFGRLGRGQCPLRVARRRNASFSRSMALVLRTHFH